MTKIDANLSGQKFNDEKLKTVDEEASSGCMETSGAAKHVTDTTGNSADFTVLVGRVDHAGGVDTQNKVKPAPALTTVFLERDEFFDWSAIRRVSKGQMTLATMAMFGLLVSSVFNDMNGFRFMEFIWALYLFMTGYKGFKGSSQSYENLIFYMIMSALQWMISVLVLTCMAYSLYDVPYYARYQSRFDFDYDVYSVSLMITELFGAAAMIGTFVTGMLGLAACCRGFGKMLAQQTLALKQQKNAAESA